MRSSGGLKTTYTLSLYAGAQWANGFPPPFLSMSGYTLAIRRAYTPKGVYFWLSPRALRYAPLDE